LSHCRIKITTKGKLRRWGAKRFQQDHVGRGLRGGKGKGNWDFALQAEKTSGKNKADEEESSNRLKQTGSQDAVRTCLEKAGGVEN